jgi:hypothetical protein
MNLNEIFGKNAAKSLKVKKSFFHKRKFREVSFHEKGRNFRPITFGNLALSQRRHILIIFMSVLKALSSEMDPVEIRLIR